MLAAETRATPRAFTLIELLIVVGIIAVLAAIAVPNFLEAQIRAKVARTRTDMRSLATAVETYRVDANAYPDNRDFFGEAILPETLSTPVAYITTLFEDPFKAKLPGAEPLRRYLWNNVKRHVDDGDANWPATDITRYGDWRLASFGPQGKYLPYIPYDPTNGTVSPGNVLRTQRSPEGRILFTYWDPNNPNA